MVTHKVLTKNSRKELIENICDKLDDKGIKNLSIIGDMSKATSTHYFTIKDPNYLPKEPFLFFTELFGHDELIPSTQTGHFGVSRLQYHGDYNGLSKIVQQLIVPGMSLPAHIIHTSKKELTDKQKEYFDRTFEDFSQSLRYQQPQLKHYMDNTELFTHTYHVDSE